MKTIYDSHCWTSQQWHVAGEFTVAVPSGISKTHDFTGTQLIAESLADPQIYEALDIQSLTDS